VDLAARGIRAKYVRNEGLRQQFHLQLSDLVIGTECGSVRWTSVLTANPASVGRQNRLVDAAATVLFEELGELFGCEDHMAPPEL
jgi:altronate dehydratase